VPILADKQNQKKKTKKESKKDDGLLDWLKGGDAGIAQPGGSSGGEESAEALKRWLDGEDDAFHSWLNEDLSMGVGASAETLKELEEGLMVSRYKCNIGLREECSLNPHRSAHRFL